MDSIFFMEGFEIKKIPLEGYRFWPSGTDLYVNEGKHFARFVFYLVEFTEFEHSVLETFKSALPRTLGDLELPISYTDPELLRILVACKFDLSKAGKMLVDSIKVLANSRSEGFENNENFYALLSSGAVYISGTDCNYRPLVVINAARMNFSKYSATDYSGLACYILSHALKYYMLPGQIENWVIIIDLGKMSLLKLPMKDLKKIISTLQTVYRCRMIGTYVVNAPKSIGMFWSVLKKLIDPNTVRKIKLCSGSVPDGIQEHFMLNQLETKYGGTAENVSEFWPETMPEGPYTTTPPPLTNKSSFEKYNPICSESLSENTYTESSLDLIDEGNEMDLRSEDSEITESVVYAEGVSLIINEEKQRVEEELYQAEMGAESTEIKRRCKTLRLIKRSLIFQEDDDSPYSDSLVKRSDKSTAIPEVSPIQRIKRLSYICKCFGVK